MAAGNTMPKLLEPRSVNGLVELYNPVRSMSIFSFFLSSLSNSIKPDFTNSNLLSVHRMANDHQYRLPELDFVGFPDAGYSRQLDPVSLAGAFSKGISIDEINNYIQQFSREVVSKAWDQIVQNHHVFTYAVDTGNVDIIKLCLEYGANVNYTDPVYTIYLLTLVIMRNWRLGRSHSKIVQLLLSHGADPSTITGGKWQNYLEAPPHGFENAIDLTTRYYLWQASRLKKRTERMLQIAEAQKMTSLLRLPYYIVGQELSVKLVIETVYAHMAQHTEKPLVLAFAGLSGHGKTELATQMGSLLSIPTITLDCTHHSDQTSLLGIPPGYVNNHEGTPLNNFLVENRERRCVVFLDEFDKTEIDVQNALLKVMDDGTYRDRRGDWDFSELDCRKVIWILASNYGDDAVSRFHAKHLAQRKPEEALKISIEPLQTELEQLFAIRFSAAITGRIDEFVPFFPFNAGEVAVVAHKFLLDMQDDARRPVNKDSKQLIGRAEIRLEDDGEICTTLGKKSYKKELGARSIYKAVRRLRRDFVIKYSDTDELVDDKMNSEDLRQYVARVIRVPGGQEVTLFREGENKRKREDE
ncbi:P-loop containing nucleoside triphosphate hydrolase protein [Hypoxylon cercidicola]|nr:P-loop containing nucleoside triphosphate hydrolase protein [Hypoxylon cercidicola]